MAERRIRVHLGITVNLGEYQSYRIDLEEESDMPDTLGNATLDEERQHLLNQLRKEIGEECSVMRKIINGEIDDKTARQLRTALGVRR